MATYDELNALNIRPRTLITIELYDTVNNSLLLTITEETLIRATVSLRSDLSRINPTLPESEIEIEAYCDTDITEQLAEASKTIRISYKWAPEGSSYSLPRRFYTDQRITWSEKILHIHAVDQVHLLDEELPPIYIGQDWYWNHGSISKSKVLHGLGMAFRDFVRGTKDANTGKIRDISDSQTLTYSTEDGTFSTMPSGGALNILQPRMTRRQAIAKMMNLCHWDFDAGTLDTFSNFWLVYVDAGRPTIRARKQTTTVTTIRKEDCGNFKESKEPAYNSITARVNDVLWLGAGEFDETYDSNMKSRIVKQQGISFEYAGFGDHYIVAAEDPQTPLLMYYFYVRDYKEDNNARKRPPVDDSSSGTRDERALKNQYGKWLLDDAVQTNVWTPNPNDYSFLDLSGAKWTSPLDPDISPDTPASLWAYWESVDIIPEDAEAVDAINAATFFVTTDEKSITKTRAGSGDAVTIEDDIFLSGHAIMRKYDNSGNITLLPDKGLECILNKSNVVGSFTWKGHPNMQPRDFVQFELDGGPLMNEHSINLQDENGDDILDESNESNWKKIITIENITLTHEGGGTISEITYREGYC